MNLESCTQEQIQTILKLCDILALQDTQLAKILLEQNGWNIQQTINQISYENKFPNSIQQQSQPVPPAKVIQQNYDDVQNLFQDDDQAYDEYYYENKSELQQKKQLFQQQHASFPLSKTTSLTPDTLEKRVSKDRMLSSQYSKHHHVYLTNLMKNTEELYNKILQQKPNKKNLYESAKKIENNRKFIAHLHQNYHTKINFTFGTFMLDLVRSYLEKKFLLVYVHKQQTQKNRAVQMILTQHQIAKFVNKNCVCYGMFDNSQDYDLIQKHLNITDLPAFILFKFNKKTQSEQFMSSYSILKNRQQNFLEWLAKQIGVNIKKKQNKSQTQVKQKQASDKKIDYFKMSDIVSEQNSLYEEMEKTYNYKRLISKEQKQKIATKQEQIQEKKKKFQKKIQHQQGKTIQINLRTPLTGMKILRVFYLKDLVNQLFDYVDCFVREEFEETYADFDLTQTFPFISLKQHKNQTIEQVFPGSQGQNIIVKEL